MALRDVALDDKYTAASGRLVMTGTQALVRLPLLQKARDRAAGLNTAGFISGYRGSPLGGYDQQLWNAKKFLEAENIVFKPGLNEDLAATAVWGSQQAGLHGDAKYDGVFGLWYGKAPGVDRSGDAFRHANSDGTMKNGGVLLVAGDDHAAKSSTLAAQSEFALLDAEIPVLNPASVQEVLEFGLYGWAMSRYAGLWVGMIALADTMDSTATVDLRPGEPHIVMPTDFVMPDGGLHIRLGLRPLEKELLLREFRVPAALAFARANPIDHIITDPPNARLGIMTAGKSYLDVLQALHDLGIDDPAAHGIRLYKVGMTAPIEPEGARRFAKGLEQVLVIEEKRELMERQLRDVLYGLSGQWPQVVGKRDRENKPLLPSVGDLSTAEIARAIAYCLPEAATDAHIQTRLQRLQYNDDVLKTLVAKNERGPYFCSGCPHNSSTKIPEGSRAAGGIGCHYLVTWMMPERSTDTFTQMGAEGTTWIGEAPFVDTPHIFSNLGDGTYFHSGLLAIRFSVAAKANITYKLLFNDAVAMTGGQHVDGTLTVPMLSRQLADEGVGKIVVVTDQPEKYGAGSGLAHGVTVEHRDELDRVQRDLREIEGVTAIIYDQTCAAEKRRRRKRGTFPDPDQRVFINQAVCEGCGDCSTQSNCRSVEPVETEFGRKRHIDQSSCNKDFSCVNGFCPSFVTVHGAKPRKMQAKLDPTTRPLPVPVLPILGAEPFNILIAGVGGTGITSLAAILGMATHLDGNGFSSLDMTGLAQKGGAVLSHMRINDGSEPINGSRIGTAMADLILAADPLVAVTQLALRAGGGDHTVTVLNNTVSPTAEFVHDRDTQYDMEDNRRLLKNAAKEIAEFDAHGAATRLLGDAMYANMMMLGFAWQRGLVPVTADAMMKAIELNGAAVNANKKAFAWGRLAAEQPDLVTAEAELKPQVAPVQTLDELIARRVSILTDYQDAAYAERYRETVDKVRATEAAKTPGFTSMAAAVARNYFKLLAYKDEYEVARLYTDGSFKAALEKEFEGDLSLEFHLAPPLFNKPDPVTGRPKKTKFGPWTMRLFKLLAGMKRLRGTSLDIFAHSEDRVTERRLIAEYEALVPELLIGLTPANHALAVALASVPDQIRGYGPVKAQSVVTAKAKEAELLAKFRSPAEKAAA
ncbi:MAG TPA: indolepyruvate ferredoxin oxidoreductase family protein [Alphaproteobacteria bacterium]|nr:indolepyruvate ferredoxin oxidoreductase family protein [Alphaproteobacteria bacterium]